MRTPFEPKLSVLPAGQRRLWNELGAVPDAFVLCGGTAIALQLGHRSSFDFDFVSSREFDPDSLYASLPILGGSQTIQKSANTLTCVINRGGPVQVSFFGTPKLRLIGLPLIAPGNQLRIASLLNLAGMKAAVVQKRAESKDYVDLDAIISSGEVDLSTALTAALSLYGHAFRPELTLKALSFFGDGNLASLPRETQARLTRAVLGVDLDSLPTI